MRRTPTKLRLYLTKFSRAGRRAQVFALIADRFFELICVLRDWSDIISLGLVYNYKGRRFCRDFYNLSRQSVWFLFSHYSHVMYQAALQLNGTSRNQYSSPGKSPTTDYIEVVSTVNRVNRKNQKNDIFLTEDRMSL